MTIPESQSICHTAKEASCLQHSSLSPDWKAENRKGKGICTLTVSDSFKSPMRLSWHIIWLSGFQSAESWHRRDLSPRGSGRRRGSCHDWSMLSADAQNVVARTLEAISWDEDVETSKREVSHQLEVYNIYKLTSFFFQIHPDILPNLMF